MGAPIPPETTSRGNTAGTSRKQRFVAVPFPLSADRERRRRSAGIASPGSGSGLRPAAASDHGRAEPQAGDDDDDEGQSDRADRLGAAGPRRRARSLRRSRRPGDRQARRRMGAGLRRGRPPTLARRGLLCRRHALSLSALRRPGRPSLRALAVAAWRLSGGGALEAPSRRTRDDWTIVALGAVVAVPFAWNTLLHQQADLVIDALVALGALMALRRRPILAGVLIGLGAAFKGPPKAAPGSACGSAAGSCRRPASTPRSAVGARR